MCRMTWRYSQLARSGLRWPMAPFTRTFPEHVWVQMTRAFNRTVPEWAENLNFSLVWSGLVRFGRLLKNWSVKKTPFFGQETVKFYDSGQPLTQIDPKRRSNSKWDAQT